MTGYGIYRFQVRQATVFHHRICSLLIHLYVYALKVLPESGYGYLYCAFILYLSVFSVYSLPVRIAFFSKKSQEIHGSIDYESAQRGETFLVLCDITTGHCIKDGFGLEAEYLTSRMRVHFLSWREETPSQHPIITGLKKCQVDVPLFFWPH